ncbi:NACHT domain-containing protein [Streptomyces sp. NPDC054829]
MTADNQREMAVADELKTLASRLIDRAFEHVGAKGPLHLPALFELAQLHFLPEWQSDRTVALEHMLRRAIRGISGTFGSIPAQEAALRLFNLNGAPDFPEVKKRSVSELGLDSYKKYQELHEDLREASGQKHTGDSTFRKKLNALRGDLARVLLKPDFPFAADSAVQEEQYDGIDNSANGSNAASPSLTRVLRLSQQLADDIDVVTIAPVPDGDSEQDGSFTSGLYVRRKIQDGILRDLKEESGMEGDLSSLLVVGEAGYGKSSLLWGLHRRLSEGSDIQPILVNAVWLRSEAGESESPLRSEELVDACAAVAQRGRRAVVLLDTADLLLHSKSDRLKVIELHESLTELGARIVTTCRPQEAGLLPPKKFRRKMLDHYDRDELKEAIKKHVAFFCPEAAPRPIEAKLHVLLGVEYGGISVARACWSPLMLRLLFEAYGSTFPSEQIDVQGIFEAYFERRIKRDVRGEQDIHLRDTSEDQSFAAHCLAIAMLALGTPEATRPSLMSSAFKAASGWAARDQWQSATSPGSLEEATDALIGRSVVLQDGLDGYLRFRHQLLFEYIAARALLERDEMVGATWLLRRLQQNPMDLFSSAVLEQILIYAWRQHPQHRMAIRSLVNELSNSIHLSLRSVALVLAAYYPDAVDGLDDLIASADKTALRRFVGLIPEVSRTTIRQKISLLHRVWQTDQSPRQAIYEALERLAVQNPQAVVNLLKRIENPEGGESQSILPDADALFSGRSLIRALALSALADREWSGAKLLEAFDIVCEAGQSRDTAIEIVRSVTENWHILRSDDFLGKIVTRIHFAQSENNQRGAVEVRDAVGALFATEWQTRFASDAFQSQDNSAWFKQIKAICRKLEENVEDVIANCQIVGVARFLELLESEASVVQETLDLLRQLLRPPSAPYVFGRSVLPSLLRSNSYAGQYARNLTARLLEGLPAPTNRAEQGPQMWAAVAREALINAELPQASLVDVLARTRRADNAALWTDPGGLSSFLLPAAFGGHEAAGRALTRAIGNPGTISEVIHHRILMSFPRAIVEEDEAFNALVHLATSWRQEGPLRKFAESGEQTVESMLRRHRVELTKLVERLIEGDANEQKQGVLLWAALDRIAAISPYQLEQLRERWNQLKEVGARGNLLLVLAEHTVRGDVPFHEAETYLRGIVEVEGNPPTLVAQGTSRHPTVLHHARLASLRIGTASGPLHNKDTLEYLLKLAVAAPTDAGVLGEHRVAIMRLADEGDPLMAFTLFEGIIDCAQKARLNKRSHRRLSNVLRTPLRRIFKAASPGERRDLAKSVLKLPAVYAEMVASAAVQVAFEDVREVLSIAAGSDLSDAVKSRIQGELQIRLRLGGTEPMDELLRPIEI